MNDDERAVFGCYLCTIGTRHRDHFVKEFNPDDSVALDELLDAILREDHTWGWGISEV